MPATISQRAARLLPAPDLSDTTAGAVIAAGESPAAGCTRWVEVADAARPLLRPSGQVAGRLGLVAFPPADARFARAVVAALLADPAAPVAVDPASQRLLALATRAARSDATVLVGGPSGAGKEVLARRLHAASRRAGGPFVAVNCAALPEAMLEALLFGHERGAFTGAQGAAAGLFRAADGGTLFLDEVGELPLALQAKLLRAIQEREVLPIGATRPIKVDVRIVAATNRDLRSEAAAGRFREDLFWRLAVVTLRLPPLAERPGDIVPLAAHLLLRHARAGGIAGWLSPCALAALTAHRWPGNVRELGNVIERALVLGDGMVMAADLLFERMDAPPMTADELASPAAMPSDGFGVRLRAAPPAARSAANDDARLPSHVARAEEAAIRAALAASRGRAEAAARLGISERTLRYKLAAMRDRGVGESRAC